MAFNHSGINASALYARESLQDADLFPEAGVPPCVSRNERPPAGFSFAVLSSQSHPTSALGIPLYIQGFLDAPSIQLRDRHCHRLFDVQMYTRTGLSLAFVPAIAIPPVSKILEHGGTRIKVVLMPTFGSPSMILIMRNKYSVDLKWGLITNGILPRLFQVAARM